MGRAAARRKLHRQGIAFGGIGIGWSANETRIGQRCLRVVKTRWPNSRTAFRKPDSKNGARRRDFYEDLDARISILARGLDSRPDALKQTSAFSIKSLADGACHTFAIGKRRPPRPSNPDPSSRIPPYDSAKWPTLTPRRGRSHYECKICSIMNDKRQKGENDKVSNYLILKTTC